MAMDIGQNLENLMKEAQKMQKRMQDAQQQLTELRVTGESGGGLFQIIMNGRHEAIPNGVKIHASLLEEDPEMLADLVVAGVNDAARKIEKASKDQISKLTAGLNIPTDFTGIGGEGDGGEGGSAA